MRHFSVVLPKKSIITLPTWYQHQEIIVLYSKLIINDHEFAIAIHSTTSLYSEKKLNVTLLYLRLSLRFTPL